MFFLHERNYQQRQKTFSTAYRNNMKTFYVVHKHPLMCKNNYFARRTVFAPPILRASMTIEAAMLLPVFILMMLNLYLVIDMLHLQAITNWHLHQLGSRICAYGYLPETLLGSEDGYELLDVALDSGVMYLYVLDEIQRAIDFPDRIYVTSASILEDGEVEIVLTYNYPLFATLGKTTEIWLQSVYLGHAWGGAENLEETGDVFVTTNGEVYHLYSDCSHLKLSIVQMPAERLGDYEKMEGMKFVPCKKCENENEPDTVYITMEQGRVHYDKGCAGLKRDVVMKELDWAKAQYALCQRCEERKR